MNLPVFLKISSFSGNENWRFGFSGSIAEETVVSKFYSMLGFGRFELWCYVD